MFRRLVVVLLRGLVVEDDELSGWRVRIHSRGWELVVDRGLITDWMGGGLTHRVDGTGGEGES